MADTHSPVVPALGPDRGRGGRRRILALFCLPVIAVAGVLTVAAVTHNGDCGGPVPGCGDVLNTGDLPVLIERTTTATGGGAQSLPRTAIVAPGDRAILWGTSNAVRVDAGQCLIVEGGPFWTAVTHTEQSSADPGRWVPIDEWGARVHLQDEPCQERS